MAGEVTCPRQVFFFVWTGLLGALATTVSPVSFKKPPQSDNIPLQRTQMESYSKNDSCRGNSSEGSLRATSSPVRWTSCTKYFFFLSLKRTMIISELRGSPGCGCLPRYVEPAVRVSQWWLSSDDENNSQCHGTEPIMMINTALIFRHRAYFILSHPDFYFQHLIVP